MTDLILNIKFPTYGDLAIFIEVVNYINQQNSESLTSMTNPSYRSLGVIYTEFLILQSTWDTSPAIQKLYASKGHGFYEFCLTQFG